MSVEGEECGLDWHGLHRCDAPPKSTSQCPTSHLDLLFVDKCIPDKQLQKMVHQAGFEPTTPAFGGQYSIQLSYWCSGRHDTHMR